MIITLKRFFSFAFLNVNLRELNVLNYLAEWSHFVPIAEWHCGHYINTIWARGWHQKYHPAAQGLRAKGWYFWCYPRALWYFYYLVVYFMKNICRNSFDIKWHQKKMALEIRFLQIRYIHDTYVRFHYIAKNFVKITQYFYP